MDHPDGQRILLEAQSRGIQHLDKSDHDGLVWALVLLVNTHFGVLVSGFVDDRC